MPDQLELVRDADSRLIESREPLQIAGGDVARGVGETFDVTVQKGLAHPRIIRPRHESRLLLGHHGVFLFGDIDGALDVRPELLGLSGHGCDVVDRGRTEVAQSDADAVAQESRVGVHPVDARRDVSLGEE